jgi:phage recombination protein Bet
MTQAIEKAAPRVSNLAQITGFSDRVIQLVKQTVAPNATPLELAAFLYNARRLGLDPMTKQIYFIKYDRNRPGEIVTGIDGYRARAENSGAYAGSDPPIFEYEAVGQPQGAPSKASVTVYKIVQGQRVPFTAEARWEEFYPGEGKQGEQYRKRPHNQLAIRAESHALRKGFPQVMQDLDMQAPPPTWEHAAVADDQARDEPEKIARDAQRYKEIFIDEEEEQATTRARANRGRAASEPAESDSPADPPADDERAAMIVEQAHAAAAVRDENVDAIEYQRQQRLEGVK